MIATYVLRGAKAGALAGLAFGAFVALVGNPLIGYAETFESGGAGGGPVVPGVVTALGSVVGGIMLGILLGVVVFGVVYYVLEPAIPGAGATKSYVLAAFGFVTVSGAPWLVLPPQPPGVEQALAVETRLAVYAGMMVAGAVASGLAAYAYNRLRSRYGRTPAVVGGLVPLGLLVVAAFGPTVQASGPIPDDLAAVFRAITVAGQVGLWFVLASVHAWLLGRERDRASAPPEQATLDGGPRSATSE